MVKIMVKIMVYQRVSHWVGGFNLPYIWLVWFNLVQNPIGYHAKRCETLRNAGWWCNFPILKNDGVKVNGKDDIHLYEMENKNVSNHQPEKETRCRKRLEKRWFSC